MLVFMYMNIIYSRLFKICSMYINIYQNALFYAHIYILKQNYHVTLGNKLLSIKKKNQAKLYSLTLSTASG